jgi:hypothetical protein
MEADDSLLCRCGYSREGLSGEAACPECGGAACIAPGVVRGVRVLMWWTLGLAALLVLVIIYSTYELTHANDALAGLGAVIFIGGFAVFSVPLSLVAALVSIFTARSRGVRPLMNGSLWLSIGAVVIPLLLCYGGLLLAGAF